MRNTWSLVTTISFFIVFVALFNFFQEDNIIDFPNSAPQYYTAGTFFQKTVNTDRLLARYEEASFKPYGPQEDGSIVKPVKILIVPGHDNQSWGAQHREIREVDLNREVANNLYDFLSEEKAFDVELASDENGYSEELLKYFENTEDIKNFRETYKAEMERLVEEGKINLKTDTFHNRATEEVVLKLYGVNKYANENKFDIVVHIHFNDHGGRKRNTVGRYNGFSIYVPESQFSNAEASKELGEHLKERFSKFFAISNNPIEKPGLIEDQELIAIGSYNTLDAASVLIEYGYIYEDQFINEKFRDVMMRELAYQTYVGIKSYFNNARFAEATPTKVIPYLWETDMKIGNSESLDILALQFLLRAEEYYPDNSNLNDCPINGKFDQCTFDSLKKYQKDKNLNTTGRLDSQTREVLNSLY
jgi:N-acetylmuramoyl-L-alanine amidase